MFFLQMKRPQPDLHYFRGAMVLGRLTMILKRQPTNLVLSQLLLRADAIDSASGYVGMWLAAKWGARYSCSTTVCCIYSVPTH